MEIQREDLIIITMDSKEAAAILDWMDHLSDEVRSNADVQDLYLMLRAELE